MDKSSRYKSGVQTSFDPKFVSTSDESSADKFQWGQNSNQISIQMIYPSWTDNKFILFQDKFLSNIILCLIQIWPLPDYISQGRGNFLMKRMSMLVKKMRKQSCNYYFLHESNDSDWKMIARFSTPYEKSLQVNFISLWKIQNGVYK